MDKYFWSWQSIDVNASRYEHMLHFDKVVFPNSVKNHMKSLTNFEDVGFCIIDKADFSQLIQEGFMSFTCGYCDICFQN